MSEDQPRYPSHEQDRFIVRMPDGMRDDLAALAKANGRSANAEIVSRLAESMSGEDRLRRIEDKLDRLLALTSSKEGRAG